MGFVVSKAHTVRFTAIQVMSAMWNYYELYLYPDFVGFS